MPGTDDPYRFFFTSSVAQQRDNVCLTGWMYDVGWPSLKIASPVSPCAHMHHTLLCSQPHVPEPQAIGDNENRLNVFATAMMGWVGGQWTVRQLDRLYLMLLCNA